MLNKAIKIGIFYDDTDAENKANQKLTAMLRDNLIFKYGQMAGEKRLIVYITKAISAEAVSFINEREGSIEVINY